MNALSLHRLKAALRFGLVSAAAILAADGQTTQINLATQGRNVDFTAAPTTKPVKTGTAIPATCQMGEFFFKTNAVAGQNLFGCTAANTWTALSLPPPVGAIVGTTDTQTLTNKSIDASEITSGTLAPSALPTANSTPGIFGDATHALQVTVDAAGRVIAITQVPVTPVAGLGDPGSNGLVLRTAPNVTTAVAAPAGPIVGATDTQTLTNKSIDASQINSGTLTRSTTGNAATATALAAAPSLCPAGQAPTGVLANGNATGCAAISGSGGGGANTPATNNVLVGTGVANGVAAGVPNVDYLAPASPALTGNPTVNGNKIGAFRLTALPASCVAGIDPSLVFATGGADALYVCDSTGHYSLPPGGSTTVLSGDVGGLGSANTVSKIGGVPVGNLATQNAPAAGIVVSDATNLSSVAAPAGSIVGTTDAQTLTNKNIDASEITSGLLAAFVVPALNQNTTGNAATASALASAPSLCPAGQAPTGVLANGNATGCAAISAGSGGASTPATTNVLVGTGVANGVAAGVPNLDYLAPANPAITGTPTVNGNKLGAFRLASLPASCVAGTDASVLFASGGTDALYVCDSTGHYSIPPGGSTTILSGDVGGLGSANTVSKIGGVPVGTLATQNAPAAGIVVSDATNLSSLAAPAGDIVGTTDTQTLTNKNIDASEITSGTLLNSAFPAVNPTPGTFGDATHAAQVTIDATGRITAAAQFPVAAAGLADPGSNGLVVRTAPNVTTTVSAPGGAIVGVTDIQTLTNKNIDASEINSGVLAAARVPTLNQNTTGNAATASALAATPSVCPAGQAPKGVLANGNATGCAVSGGAATPATTSVLVGTGVANGVAAGVPNLNYLAPASPAITGTPTVNGNKIGAFRVASLPASCVAGTDSSVIFASGGTDAIYLCDGTGHYAIPPGGSTTVLSGDVGGLGSANTLSKIGGVPVGNLATQNAPAAGIVVSDATNLSSLAAPVGDIVGTTDSQTLTNKNIDASEITSGTLTNATLPSVNPTPGMFGDASHSAQLTVDAQGRITAISQLPVNASSGLGDPGANGVVIRTGANVTTSVAAPVGAIVGTSDTQTLTNKSIDASEITSGALAAARVSILNQNTTGNAATASALAAAPALCPTGQAPTGVLPNGNATGCAAISAGSGGANTPATTNVLIGTGVANGVTAGTPNVDYLAPASPAMTGTPTVNGSKIAAFRVAALPASCVVGTDSTVLFASGGTDAVYACDNTGHYSVPPGGSTTVLSGDVIGVGSANTVSKIGGTSVGNLATQNAPVAGIMTSDGTNVASMPAPAGALVGLTDTQTLTNKSIDTSEINSGTLAAGRLPAFSGDVLTTAGTSAAVLAIVNTTPGTFGDSTHSAQVTVDGKGRVTSISQLSVAPTGLADPGANGLVVRTAANVTTSVPAPAGSLVGTSALQTLTNKSLDASEVNSGTLAAARIPVLNQNTTGSAATAAALAATPTQCTGQFAKGVAANGNANCATVSAVLGYTPQDSAAANANNDPLGAAATAQANAQTFAANASNLSSGTVPAARIPLLNQDTTGNAASATALATLPALCPAGQAPTGILATGDATGCAATGGGLQAPPATGIVTGTIGSTITGSIPAPAGTVVGTTDTQILSHKDLTAATNTFPSFPLSQLTGVGNLAGQNSPTAGVVTSNGTALSSRAAPAGALVGTTDTQTLTGKSIDASEINSGTLTASRIPAFSGDIVTAAGSTAAALPAVNPTPGTFGDATHSAKVTVDAKGRVTAVTQLLATSTGLADPGANGVVIRTAANTTSTVVAPAGVIVGTTDTQTLTGKSIDASEINTGTFTASRIPAFSGDIVTAAGSTAAALPAVNTTPGTFGDATHSAQVTVDAKGRVTAVSQLLAAATGLADPGANGIVIRTAANTTSTAAAPVGTIVGTTDTQTLTGKSIDASEINSGTLAAARVPLLNQNTTGNSGTATALAAVPAQCTGQVAKGVAANGNANCATVPAILGYTPQDASAANTNNDALGAAAAAQSAAQTFSANASNLTSGTVAAARIPALNQNTTGNAATASALAATPALCPSGQAPTGILPNGNATGCAVSGGGGLQAPPATGIVTGTVGSNVTGSIPAPSGTVVGTTDTQTLSHKDLTAATNTFPSFPLSQITGTGTLAAQSTPVAGIVTSNGTTLSSRAAPAGTIVGTTDTQTLTGKSIDASEINSGTLTAGRIPAFSGDIVTVAGSTAAALPAVNSTPGTFGDATHSAQVTVDAKGRITAVSQLLAAASGLADPGANGIVIRTAANTTSTLAAPAGVIVGTSDTQTLTGKSIDASEINSGTLTANRMPAFSGDIVTTAGFTAATLPTVNASPGTFGDSTHTAQLTIDAKGRVTGLTLLTITGVSGGGNISSGGLATLPATCATGTLYFVTDQPAGQQLYTCSSTNTWTQLLNLGGSGALLFTGGSLDINPAVVPSLAAANNFTALTTASAGLSLLSPNPQPVCGASARGTFWYVNNGSAKDSVQVCVYTGSAFAWTSLY